MDRLTGTWMTEGGLETDLIFNQGIQLQEFAAFPLLDSDEGRSALTAYYAQLADIAARAGVGLLIETPTWRASAHWGAMLGYDADDLQRLNRDAVALVRAALDGSAVSATRVSGSVGPRGDAYLPSQLPVDAAAEYHEPQVRALADAGVDLVHATTVTAASEAAGVVRAARAVGVPVAISFTVETDGRLPDGSSLAHAIAAVDAIAPPDLYGLNCAHPTHVLAALDGGPWQERMTIFRPNASTSSHAELDAMDCLDRGDLALLVDGTKAVRERLTGIRVVGGCCGTDARHLEALAALLGA